MNDKEQGKVAEDPMEDLGLLTTEIVSGTTIEPVLHTESSECLPPLTQILSTLSKARNHTPSTCNDGNYGYGYGD